jgi:hypothetical protein
LDLCFIDREVEIMMKQGMLWLAILVLFAALVGCSTPGGAANMPGNLTVVLSDEATQEVEPVEVTPTEVVSPTDELTPQPTEGTSESDAESTEDAMARAGCEGNNGTIPPHAETLAGEYDTTVDVIMGWFCQGYGFGEIEQAYQLSQESGKSVEEIFAMREQGMGWGAIKKELSGGKSGLGCNPHDEDCTKKPNQGCNPHDEDCTKKPSQGCNPHDEDCNKPGGPPDDRGNGNKKPND